VYTTNIDAFVGNYRAGKTIVGGYPVVANLYGGLAHDVTFYVLGGPPHITPIINAGLGFQPDTWWSELSEAFYIVPPSSWWYVPASNLSASFDAMGLTNVAETHVAIQSAGGMVTNASIFGAYIGPQDLNNAYKTMGWCSEPDSSSPAVSKGWEVTNSVGIAEYDFKWK